MSRWACIGPGLGALAPTLALDACGGDGDSNDRANAGSAAGAASGAASAASADPARRSRIPAAGPAAIAWVTLPSIEDLLFRNLAITADTPVRGIWSASMP